MKKENLLFNEWYFSHPFNEIPKIKEKVLKVTAWTTEQLTNKLNGRTKISVPEQIVINKIAGQTIYNVPDVFAQV